jgi:hypothetical protein
MHTGNRRAALYLHFGVLSSLWSERAHKAFVRRDELHWEFAKLIGVESADDELSELAHYGIDPVLDAFAKVGPGDPEKFLSALDGNEPERFFRYLVMRWPEEGPRESGYAPRENLTSEEAEALTQVETEIEAENEYVRLRAEGFDLRRSKADKWDQHLPFYRELIEAGLARLKEARPQDVQRFDFAKEVLDDLVNYAATWVR